MKILTVIGARPQFIKAAVVSRAFQKSAPEVREILVHTGQHYDTNMSDVFFDELDIPQPNFNLCIGGGTHGQNTGRMIEKIEATLFEEQPDWVLVYGDTDSTLAGALAAAKLHIPVAHIEAGLRSYNRRMPEEINRVLTDHVAGALFSPTDTASRNLANEGVDSAKVHQVGDVMYDAALFYSERAEQRSKILDSLGLQSKSYVLATIHRVENTDDRQRMENIIRGFSHSQSPVIWPMHPRTAKCLESFGLQLPSVVHAIEPVGYIDMVMLEKHAALIATDSGGVQKEAYFHNVPCLTMRDETEWVELVEIGANQLVSADHNKISHSLAMPYTSNFTNSDTQLYGDGDTGRKIAQAIAELT